MAPSFSFSHTGSNRCQHVYHTIVDQAVAGHYLVVENVVGRTIKGCYHAARFTYHQDSCCHIPCFQFEFPETIQPSGSHVGQSSAAAPARRIPLALFWKAMKLAKLLAGSVAQSYGKPVPRSELLRGIRLDTDRRLPFRYAPSPLDAVKSSS